MKIKKLISTLMAGLMLATVANTSVFAEETKEYKLSELMEMSKEEFLELDGAENCYIEITNDEEMYKDFFPVEQHSMVFNFTGDTRRNDYIPYFTEKKLMDLLDTDNMNLKVGSNVNSGEAYYNWVIMVGECNKDYPDGSVLTQYEITDDNILTASKIYYCINQVMSFSYTRVDSALGTAQINYGEADGNDKLTANDAAFIAKAIAEDRVAELPETADFNGDGVISAFDCAKIAQFITAKALAKATGMVG